MFKVTEFLSPGTAGSVGHAFMDRQEEAPNQGNGQGEAKGGVLKCRLHCPRRLRR